MKDICNTTFARLIQKRDTMLPPYWRQVITVFRNIIYLRKERDLK